MDLTQINELQKEVSLHLNSILSFRMNSALEIFTNYDH